MKPTHIDITNTKCKSLPTYLMGGLFSNFSRLSGLKMIILKIVHRSWASSNKPMKQNPKSVEMWEVLFGGINYW